MKRVLAAIAFGIITTAVVSKVTNVVLDTIEDRKTKKAVPKKA